MDSPIQRQVFDWGVQLITRPFEGDKSLGGMLISVEINLPRPNRGCIVKVIFSAALTTASLTLQDTQAWQNALSGITDEARAIVSEMKAAAKASDSKSKKTKTAKRKK